MAAFPEAWMNELLNKSDLVSLVSEYASLKKKGAKLWCCCPFHSEKTPSFSVSPDKQLYYCFGCHAGGGVIKFVMDIESLSFPDALKHLARRAGMELPEEIDNEKLRMERALREKQYDVCADAARFFHRQLTEPAGASALAYLTKRGLDLRIIRKFGLGYAPDERKALFTSLKAQGYTDAQMCEAGVVRRKSAADGSTYYCDAFYNRVIFPIIAANGKVIGFGARAMGSEQPKYINTGETRIFNKRYNLFALNLVRKKRIEDIIVVEGYMDVISLFKYGIENVVASLGTALTREQARLIKRYAPTVYISYDGDSAGQAATIRGMDILADEGLRVRVIVIPDDLDPDDFVRKFGRDGFLKLKDNAMSLNAFKLFSMARESDLTGDDGREEYALKACAFVSSLKPVERERFFSEISRNSGLPIDTVRAQCASDSAAAKHNEDDMGTDYDKRALTQKSSQRYLTTLIRCAILNYSAATLVLDNAENLALGDELERALKVFSNERDCSFDTRLMLANDDFSAQTQALIASAAFDDETILDPKRTASDCIDRYRAYMLNIEAREIAARIDANAAAYEDYESLTRVNEELSALKRKAYQ